MKPSKLQPTPAGFMPSALADIGERLTRLERAGPAIWFAPLEFYLPYWGAADAAPDIGDGELGGWWTSCNYWRLVRGYLRVGSTTTFGSGAWMFGFPAGLPPIGFSNLGGPLDGEFSDQSAGVAAVITPEGVVHHCGVHTTAQMTLGAAAVRPDFPPQPGFRIYPTGVMVAAGTDSPGEPWLSGSSFAYTAGTLITWQSMVHVGPHMAGDPLVPARPMIGDYLGDFYYDHEFDWDDPTFGYPG